MCPVSALTCLSLKEINLLLSSYPPLDEMPTGAFVFTGLAIGDVPDKQPIGIVLTVLGVVVLDFCADATEGPIRAYLLDVVDSEEQDMALNIHAFSAGT